MVVKIRYHVQINVPLWLGMTSRHNSAATVMDMEATMRSTSKITFIHLKNLSVNLQQWEKKFK